MTGDKGRGMMAGMDDAAGADWAARLRASLAGAPMSRIDTPDAPDQPPIQPPSTHVAVEPAAEDAPTPAEPPESVEEAAPASGSAPVQAARDINEVLAALDAAPPGPVHADLAPLPRPPLFEAMQPTRPAPIAGPGHLLSALELSLQPAAHPQAARPVAEAFAPPPGTFDPADLAALDAMRADAAAMDGAVVDWFGLRTPIVLAPELASHAGTVLPRLVLADPRASAGEWIGLAVSVVGARESWRALDVGAGRGDLLLAGAVAARRRGLGLSLHATEGESERFAVLRAHAEVNGIAPTAHRFQQAELGADPNKLPRHAALAQDWLGDEHAWDWVRIARPETLWVLLRTAVELLSARVRVLSLTTHGRMTEATALRALPRAGWRLVAEAPSVVDRANPRGCKSPGVQVWRGPLA